jgi:hypothetical protein
LSKDSDLFRQQPPHLHQIEFTTAAVSSA